MNLITTSDLNLACGQPELVGTLKLKDTQLAAAPKEIGMMVNMGSLQLEGNCIQDMAGLLHLLGKLPALRNLHLSLAHGDLLPDSIGALTHLEYLKLQGRSLHALPGAMGALQKLKNCDLFVDNWIGDAPHLKPLGSLGLLRRIDLRCKGNPPLGLAYLGQVTGLSVNLTVQFPIGIGGMHSLEWLALESNEAGAGKPLDLRGIGGLANLVSLRIQVGVPLEFPASMAGMKCLREIHMQRSAQQVLPNGFADLPAIQLINANRNRLAVLPDWIGELKTLTHLHLDHNSLQRLPDSLASATGLTHLSLDNNAFTEFPGVILRSPSLKEVSLRDNRISTVAVPEGCSSSLGCIHLTGNRLASFPWALLEMPKLRISLSGNPFLHSDTKEMGEAIYALTGRSYSLETRRSLCALAVRDIPKALETVTLDDFLIALREDDRKLRVFAMEALGRYLSNPFAEMEQVTSIRISGQSKTYSLPELKKQLEGRGIKVNKGKPGAVEVMVLAEKPGEEVLSFIGAGARPATIAQLAAFVGKGEAGWLEAQSLVQPKVSENLGRLLGSGNGESMALALRMMGEGGVPEGLVSAVLAIHLVHPDTKVRKAAGALFIASASPQLNVYLQGERRNLLAKDKQRLVKQLETFCKHSGIDKAVFAKQAFAIDKGLGALYAPYAKPEDLAGFMDKEGYINLPVERMSEMPAALLAAERVDSVSFELRGLRSLPTGIGRLKGLRRLNVRQNKLRDLPESFRELQELAFLDLGYNEFEVFPEQVCDLRALSSLVLQGNPFTELPFSLARLENLRELHCSRHELARFPEVVGELTQLELLDFGGSGWTELPKALLKLGRLRSLLLQGHRVGSLPEGIGALPLELLDLTYNDLKQLPEDFAHLRSLKHLKLSVNKQLRALPAGIGALENLETLLIDVTGISSLPASFAELKCLRKLDISTLGFEEPGAVIALLQQLPALERIRYENPPVEGVKEAMRAGLPGVRMEWY